MIDQPEVQRGRSGPTGLVEPMRRVLRVWLIAVVVGLPAVVLIGYLVAGVPGAWGAAIGMGLAVGFLSITVAVALGTARMGPNALGVSVLTSWVVKIVLLMLVLVLLRDADFYSRPVLFVALLIGTVGTLLLEAFVVMRTKVPYVEPGRR